MGDEPYQFAMDMYDVLQAAGWNIVGMRAVMLQKPWKGAMVRFHVSKNLNLPDGAPVDVPTDTLAHTLISALMRANVGCCTVQPTPEEPEDSISLVIGPYPRD